VARKERRVAEHGLRPAERLHRKHLDGQHAEHAEEECLEIGRDLGQHGGAENSSSNNPSDGGEHHFYDETRALLASIPAGATVRLQKDVGDLAAFYVIDLIDLEQVPPPLAMPANFLSIVTDCGAIPNDGLNDEPAIRTCIANAKAQGTGVWIPAGTFENTTQAFSVSDVTIRGAGMWYSTIHGPHASFHCAGNNCRFYDFSVFGESVTRQIVLDEFGFLGKAGTGSRLENIWVEHTQVGYWVGSNDSTKPVTDGLVITGARIRNTFADGVNFCNGTSNSEVVNSHFRNTGDDAVASWSPRSDSTNVGNMIHFNTVQIPWRANCYAIYGGRDNKIEDNLCYDVVTYPGIMVAQDFESNAFAGVTSVQRNTVDPRRRADVGRRARCAQGVGARCVGPRVGRQRDRHGRVDVFGYPVRGAAERHRRDVLERDDRQCGDVGYPSAPGRPWRCDVHERRGLQSGERRAPERGIELRDHARDRKQRLVGRARTVRGAVFERSGA